MLSVEQRLCKVPIVFQLFLILECEKVACRKNAGRCQELQSMSPCITADAPGGIALTAALGREGAAQLTTNCQRLSGSAIQLATNRIPISVVQNCTDVLRACIS